MLKMKIRLKEVLKERRVTQKQLEELSGVPQSKISVMCNNKLQELNIGNLERIACSLGIKDVSEILQFEECTEE